MEHCYTAKYGTAVQLELRQLFARAVKISTDEKNGQNKTNQGISTIWVHGLSVMATLRRNSITLRVSVWLTTNGSFAKLCNQVLYYIPSTPSAAWLCP